MGAGQEQYHLNIAKEISIAAACVDEGGGDQGPCFLIIPRGCEWSDPKLSMPSRSGGGSAVKAGGRSK